MQSDSFFTHSLKNPSISRILNAALEGVEPGKLVQDSLNHIDFAPGDLFALGLGKGAEPMVYALSKSRKLKEALVITKHASGTSRESLRIIEAGHPIPDERSLQAGNAALEFASKIGASDTLICLISGGGSALVCTQND
jgi:glycerate-2-kinase